MSLFIDFNYIFREDRDESIHTENMRAVTEAGLHTLLFEAVREFSGDVDVLLDIVNTITCLADMGEFQIHVSSTNLL